MNTIVEAEGGIADHTEYRCVVCDRTVEVLIVDDVVELAQGMHYSAALFVSNHFALQFHRSIDASPPQNGQGFSLISLTAFTSQLTDTVGDICAHLACTVCPSVKLAFAAHLADHTDVVTYRMVETRRIPVVFDCFQVLE